MSWKSVRKLPNLPLLRLGRDGGDWPVVVGVGREPAGEGAPRRALPDRRRLRAQVHGEPQGHRNARRWVKSKGPDGGCDRLTYWLTDWLRLQTIRFAWLKPCVSNHCKCGTWCLLNYYKRLSWRSQKNLKIIESDLTLDRIGHLV